MVIQLIPSRVTIKAKPRLLPNAQDSSLTKITSWQLVGAFRGIPPPFYATAKAKKIPTFCSVEIEKGTANYPQFYACAPSTIGYGQVPILFKSGWKTVAYLNYQGFPPSAPLVEKGQKAAGTHVSLKIVTVPLTTTDFTPIAAEVKSLGADAVLSQLAGSGDQAMIQAMVTEGLKIPYLETSGQAYSTTIAFAAQHGVQYYVASSWINDPHLSSVRKQELADLAKYAPGINDTTADPTNNSWLYPRLLKIGADSGHLKEFTSAAIAKWASSQAALATGITAPLAWAHNGPLPGERRFVNLYAIEEAYNPPSTTPVTKNLEWTSLSYPNKKHVIAIKH